MQNNYAALDAELVRQAISDLENLSESDLQFCRAAQFFFMEDEKRNYDPMTFGGLCLRNGFNSDLAARKIFEGLSGWVKRKVLALLRKLADGKTHISIIPGIDERAFRALNRAGYCFLEDIPQAVLLREIPVRGFGKFSADRIAQPA